MLINLRNALMAGKRLPYDAEVEYLESSGTQYIDTGYSFNSATDKVELVFELLTTTPNYKWIFGAYDTKRFAIGSGDNVDRRTFGYNASTSYISSTYYTDGAHIFLADSTGASIDGQNFFGFADFSTTSHILLYTIPLNPSVYCSNARIWSYKHYRNGTLVRDYIPVRKGTVGYLYDRVSGKLFGNAGTGDFVLGPDVVPVEWLEGTGTQYIDTGVGYFADFEINVKMRTSLSNITLYSGAYNRLERISAARPYWRFRSNAGGTYDSTIPITELHTLAWRNGKIYSDGAEIYQLSKPYQNYEMYAFGTDTSAFSCVIYYLDLWDSNDTIVRKFRPVRVGTGSTWEGAMMDVLTRRIYRNAGTGAFTYGNDLKYPIPAE